MMKSPCTHVVHSARATVVSWSKITSAYAHVPIPGRNGYMLCIDEEAERILPPFPNIQQVSTDAKSLSIRGNCIWLSCGHEPIPDLKWADLVFDKTSDRFPHHAKTFDGF